MLALALAASAPAIAADETAEATPGLEWEFWHDQLAACHRADRIAAQCAHGTCDKEALVRAQAAIASSLIVLSEIGADRGGIDIEQAGRPRTLADIGHSSPFVFVLRSA